MQDFLNWVHAHSSDLLLIVESLAVAFGLVSVVFFHKVQKALKKIINKDGKDIDGDGIPDIEKSLADFEYECPICGTKTQIRSMEFQEVKNSETSSTQQKIR